MFEQRIGHHPSSGQQGLGGHSTVHCCTGGHGCSLGLGVHWPPRPGFEVGASGVQLSGERLSSVQEAVGSIPALQRKKSVCCNPGSVLFAPIRQEFWSLVSPPFLAPEPGSCLVQRRICQLGCFWATLSLPGIHCPPSLFLSYS